MTDDAQLAENLEQIAVEVAEQAARHVAAAARPDSSTTAAKSSATDLVTEVDQATERLLIAAIRAHRPDDAVLGEEGGRQAGRSRPDSNGRSIEPVEWVLDPIDGTVNFVLGLPAFSVSVAARREGVTLAGCVVDVSRGEVFHARIGGGSWLRSPGAAPVRLRGPRTLPLAEMVVGTGFAYDDAIRVRQGLVLSKIVSQVGNIRRLGSAALDLCFVAAGRLDGYYEAGLKEWDRAAGILIVSEAGAAVEVLSGRAGELTIATSAVRFAELKQLLRELDAHEVMG